MSRANEIHRAYELGQSFWLDFIRRDLLENGELASLIEADEVRGVTSNPSIFKQAIGDSDLYLASMRPMAHAGWSAEKIFETLAVDDIRAATDLFLPLYEGTDARDGYVSIEVNPQYAADTEKTLVEARRLWETINRPNLMVKIPATQEGVPAIEQGIYEGININVTLIFSLDRYSEVMEAYIKGLQRRTAEGQSVDRVASVASFFVSRVDTAVDQKLEVILRQEGSAAERAHALLGKAAIANAKMAYAQFKSVFYGEHFERLRESGARAQRPLWASTSTKNPNYSDVLYVDELIGLNTVNTLPPKTLDAFRDHGSAEDRLEIGLSDARAQLEALEALDVSLDEITLDLERDGVRSFADAYTSLIETVEERASNMRDELGAVYPSVSRHLEHLDAERVSPRFWRIDPDLWPETKGGSVIKMRLDWLEADFGSHSDVVNKVIDREERAEFSSIGWINGGYERHAIEEAAGRREGVAWLDSLDPVELRRFARRTPVELTLFVAESRSHAAPGTKARLAAVWRRGRNRTGDDARNHFISVAPAGSQLTEWSEGQSIVTVPEWNFSSGAAVSSAGMLFAALLGADPIELARGAQRMKARCVPGAPAALNPGLYLGALLASGVQIHVVADPSLEARGKWLVKYLRARIHVAVQAGLPDMDETVVIYLRSDGELEGFVRERTADGGSLAILQSRPGLAGVGEEAVRWEIAAAVAAYLREDPTYAEAPMMPDVNRASKMLERWEKKGSISLSKPIWDSESVSVWWGGAGAKGGVKLSIDHVADLVIENSSENQPLFIGFYQAQSRSLRFALAKLRQTTPVVSEFGRLPEAKLGSGFALLISRAPKRDLEIPGSALTFGDLQLASMIADFEQIKGTGHGCCGLYFKTAEANVKFLKQLSESASKAHASYRAGAKMPEGER